jgi:hypothetical protein
MSQVVQHEVLTRLFVEEGIFIKEESGEMGGTGESEGGEKTQRKLNRIEGENE